MNSVQNYSKIKPILSLIYEYFIKQYKIDMTKDNIREYLIAKGRGLVTAQGAAFLTARKLAEASGCSVGTIYNQFANMDNFIMAENLQTLDELAACLRKLQPDSSAYKTLNRYLDGFVRFVLGNRNLWFMLYNFHLQAGVGKLPRAYLRRLVGVIEIWRPAFEDVFCDIRPRERRLSMQVLWLSLFSVSSFLTTRVLDNMGGVSKKTICKLLLNTYLAGLTALKKD